MRWTLPYIDQPPAFWRSVSLAVAPDIASVYFPLPRDVFGSGRPPQPAEHIEEFLGVSAVEKAVLLNPVSHEGSVEEVLERIAGPLGELIDRYGVAEAVVADVGLARLLRREFPRLRLAASTLLEVTTPEQTEYLEDAFHVLTPGDGAMRDLHALRALRDAWGGALRLMVNEGCLPGCVYRRQHFREMDSGVPLPASLCAEMLEREPWLALTGAWVLPQHLDLFDGLYDELKLSGRVTLADPVQYMRVLDAYLHRTPLELAEIGGGPATAPRVPPVTRDFYMHTLACDKACATCAVCREYHACGAWPPGGDTADANAGGDGGRAEV